MIPYDHDIFIEPRIMETNTLTRYAAPDAVDAVEQLASHHLIVRWKRGKCFLSQLIHRHMICQHYMHEIKVRLLQQP